MEGSGFFQEEGWKISNTDKSLPRGSSSNSGCWDSPYLAEGFPYLAEGFHVSFCLSVCPSAEGHRQMFYLWAVLLPSCRPQPLSGGTSLKPRADFTFLSDCSRACQTHRCSELTVVGCWGSEWPTYTCENSSVWELWPFWLQGHRSREGQRAFLSESEERVRHWVKD